MSFSTEDKKFVKKLYDILCSKFKIIPWYSGEKFHDHIPDFILYDINEAMKNSNYCIAIFSENIINSKWVFAELGGFFARETLEDRIIIPVLHGISHEEFILNFPIFADRFVIFDSDDIEDVASQIAKFICWEQKSQQENSFVKKFWRYFHTFRKYTKSQTDKLKGNSSQQQRLEITDPQSPIKRKDKDPVEDEYSISDDWIKNISVEERAVIKKFLNFLGFS